MNEAMTATAQVTQETELRQELTVVQQAAVVRITDQVTYDAATSLLLDRIIPFRKRWKAYWEPLKKAAKEAHNAVCAKFNEGDEPAERAEKQVKVEIARWDAEQERIRQEAQRKAQEEAERQEAERRMAESFFAEEAGASGEEVAAIMDAPVVAVAEPVLPTYERATGISKRDNWVGYCTDLKKLCAAIAKGQAPINFVLVNQTALNARARSDRETFCVPGCIAKNEPIVTGRGR